MAAITNINDTNVINFNNNESDSDDPAIGSAPGGHLTDCFDSPSKGSTSETGHHHLAEITVLRHEDDKNNFTDNNESDTNSTVIKGILEVGGRQLEGPNLIESSQITEKEQKPTKKIEDASSTETKSSINENEKASDETDHMQELKRHDKHIFVLSEAGKPIFANHCNENFMSNFFAIVQTLVSFVESNNDQLRNIRCFGGKFKTAPLTICLARRGPLIFAATSRLNESTNQLGCQINSLYNQILLLLTRSALLKVFESRGANYDLRRILYDAEETLSTAFNLSFQDPALFLHAVRLMPMHQSDRDTIGQALVWAASTCKVKNLVYALLVARRQVITVVRMKRFPLHPADLHAILNLVSCKPSFRNAQSWSPICLPNFDDSGFLHAHISYLDESCDACLLMLTADRNAFDQLSNVKRKFMEKLVKSGKTFSAVKTACQGARCYDLEELGYPDLWHFVYKNRTSSQMCSSLFTTAYAGLPERNQLLQKYARLIDFVHNSSSSSSNFDCHQQNGGKIAVQNGPPLRIVYRPGENETLLAWVTPNFELYLAFSPFVEESTAVLRTEKLLKALKKDEDRFFLVSMQTFS